MRRALEFKIEQALNPIEETLRDQIVEIVRDSQLHIFESYKASRAETLQVEAQGGEGQPQAEGTSAGGQAAQEATEALEDQLQPYRPEPYFDSQFDEFNGEFFDFMQMQFDYDWDDSGYGSSAEKDALSPSVERSGAT